MFRTKEVWKIVGEMMITGNDSSYDTAWIAGWNKALTIVQSLLAEATNEGSDFKRGRDEGGYRVKVREMRTAEVIVDAISERQAIQKAVLMRQELNADDLFDWHVEDRTWTASKEEA